MLSADEARTISAVGGGTPIGDLLRRYWMPIAGVSEVERQRVLPVRILGEDLVVYKDRHGRYGLLERWCPHRQFDLAYGTVEDCGLRCSYHGWRFDERGACLEQPFEDAQNPDAEFRQRVRTRAYAVQAFGGFIWAYLGPEPAPLIPDWAGFYTPGYTVLSCLHVPCNWVQIMEGFYDPVHVEWLHDRWSYRLHGHDVPESRPRHLAFRWLDFDYGVVFQRKLKGSDDWLADRTVLFPNVDGAGGQGWYLTWVVPVDDVNTILVYRLTITNWKTPFGQIVISPKAEFDQPVIPCHRTSAVVDAQPGATAALGSNLISQDVVAWLGQGPRADRTHEHLTQADAGVIMFRKRLFEQARVAAEGGDPIGIIRDPAKNRRINLPGPRKNYGLKGEGLPGMEGDDDVMLKAFLPFDLPVEIKQAIGEAMSKAVAGRRPASWTRPAKRP